MARPVALLSAAALAGCLGACGGGDREQVEDTVTAFRDATAKKDYDRICRRVLAPALVSRLTDLGLPCQVALSKYLGGTRRPTLTLSRVVVRGVTAQAYVASGAQGQARSRDVLGLVRTRDGWRIASLAAPAGS